MPHRVPAPDRPEGSPPGSGPPERRIKGRTLAERRADRREAMLAAGLDLFGTRGYAATSVDDVCRRAAVSTRNFYEEFENRQALLAAVGERIVAGAFAAWSDAGGSDPAEAESGADAVAERLRERLAAVVPVLVGDPRVAQVAFVESVGMDPAHEAGRRRALAVFPAWLEAYLRGHLTAAGVPPGRRRSVAVGLFGAVHEMLADWVLQAPEDQVPVAELVDAIADVVSLVLRLPSHPFCA